MGNVFETKADDRKESKIGEVIFFSACYAKAADEEVTLSCRCHAHREEDTHTSAVAHAHMCFVYSRESSVREE
jgi:hypothetical protein